MTAGLFGPYGPLKRQAEKRRREQSPTCEAHARRGTGSGVCGFVLDERGNCPWAREHLDQDEVIS